MNLISAPTDVPDEVQYPTQPFPTKPPPFAAQGVSPADANDLTPEIHAPAVEEMRRFRLGPLFRPPSPRGTLQLPGARGGASWGGAAFDHESGFLYVRSSEGVETNPVCPNAGDDPEVDVEYSKDCPYGASLVMFREAGGPGATPTPESKLGLIPLTKPPYAHRVAIDLNAGEIAWKVPFGEGSQEIREHPLLRGVELLERLGARGNSGPMVTKGGSCSSAAPPPTCMPSTRRRALRSSAGNLIQIDARLSSRLTRHTTPRSSPSPDPSS